MTSFVIVPTMIIALGFSILVLARSTWRLIFGAKNRWIEVVSSALLVGAATFIAADLIQDSRVAAPNENQVFALCQCLICLLAIVTYTYHRGTLYGIAWQLRRNIHAWILFLVPLAMVGWCNHRIEVRSRDFSLVGIEVPLPGTVELELESIAKTDTGTVVPLYKLSVAKELFEEYVGVSEEKFRDYNHFGIRRENADRRANCHGWVFTGGKFLLKGHDVESILKDNGYTVVKEPQPEDVVIYRDANGQILHTALVQAVLRDGSVITESKWGIDQRYIHLPEDQPYSQRFDFYRTQRSNHLLQILDSDSLDPELLGG